MIPEPEERMVVPIWTRMTRPFEVWLTRTDREVKAMVVRADETTYDLEVLSTSMRGAQREMTGWALSNGYEPVGGWEALDDSGIEAMRVFRPKEPRAAEPAL
jgi:hypothetical protein